MFLRIGQVLLHYDDISAIHLDDHHTESEPVGDGSDRGLAITMRNGRDFRFTGAEGDALRDLFTGADGHDVFDVFNPPADSEFARRRTTAQPA